MKRILFALLAVALSLGAAGGKGPATAPASRPATAPATRPATAPAEGAPEELTHGHAPTPPRKELLRRARQSLRLHRKTIELAKAGKYEQCIPLLEELLRIDPTDSMAWYNMACVHSRMGKPEKALAALDKALEHGYSDFRYMQRDPDFDPIRALPGYAAVLKRNEQVQRRRAEKLTESLRKRFGEGYIVEVDHPDKLVFATDIDRRTLEELKDHLTAYAKAQWKSLFTHRFEQYVTIVVPAKWPPSRRRLGGYYLHSQRMLMAKQIGMVMTHEFTHALHDADQDGLGQRHPIWVTEGLATLFETSTVTPVKVRPEPNRRLNLLKRLIARGRTIPFKDIVKLSHAEFMKKTVVGYAQVRYMMMYMYAGGRLKQWYDAYTAGFEKDKTGAKALEKVYGMKLSKIEAKWKRWVRKQKSPPVRLRRNSAYIGVQTRSLRDGLKIVTVVPGSGAEKAGLASGDVIVSVDGQRMVDSAELLKVVSSAKVGQKLRVGYRRDGEYYTAEVTLGRWTGRRPPRPRPKTRPKPRPRTAPTRPASRPAKKAA
ncbi:hypothetical protein LCGC14_1452120 [marine sediment metagenome]|uniref:PDZ domain-containing protein n=1 Tax=marine sediment metagenome TaxID=412755 RepID=A0A0F9JIC4_9ZZZZ